MKIFKRRYFVFIVFVICFNLYGNDIDDVEGYLKESAQSLSSVRPNQVGDNTHNTEEKKAFFSQLPQETIYKIAQDKNLFLISTTSKSFYEGDYLNIAWNNVFVAKGLAAKAKEELMAVKITQVLDENFFKTLKKGERIFIHKGEFPNFSSLKTDISQENLIKAEEDLFDYDFENERKKSNKVIENDNLLSLGFGQYFAIDEKFQSTNYPIFMGSWAYQIANNFWANISYGRSVVRDFPTTGIDTTVDHLLGNIKYSFMGPVDVVIMPYVGVQVIRATSPAAGQSDENVSQQDLDKEVELVQKFNTIRPALGIGLLRQFVPGWYIHANVGIDFLGAYLSLEF